MFGRAEEGGQAIGCVACNNYDSVSLNELYQHIITNADCVSYYRCKNLKNPIDHYAYLGEKPACVSCGTIERDVGIHQCTSAVQNVINIENVYECVMCSRYCFSEDAAKTHKINCFKNIELLNKYIEENRPTMNIYTEGACQHCSIEFYSVEEFNEHVATCFKCHTCGVCFNSTEEYDGHVSARLKCTKCEVYFCTTLLLNEHQSTCCKCQYCNVVFQNISEWDEHRQNYVLCLDCSAGFCTYKLKDAHLTNCFRCYHCSGLYNNSYEFARHTTENNLKFICESCHCMFFNVQSLRDHNKEIKVCKICLCMFCNERNWQIHSDGFKTCSWCEISFCNQQLWTQHSEMCRIRRHNECYKCMAKFNTSDELQVHIQTCRIDSDCRFECDQCDVISTSPTLHSDHFRHSHPTLNRINCPFCRRQIGINKFTEHVEKVHDNHTQLPANQDRMSAAQINVDQCGPVHFPKISFACSLCSDYCEYEDNTKICDHMKEYHSIEQKIRCPHCFVEVCARNFPSHCNQHGDSLKPFQCPKCLQYCATRNACVRHMTQNCQNP